MTETLQIKDTIQRVGYTVIDGVKVVQHTCTITSDNPTEMRVGMVKLNTELYKTNRATCRDDYAVFEDAAYALQEELLAKMKDEDEEPVEVVEGEIVD